MKKITNLEYNTLIWFIIRAGLVGLSIKNIISISKQDSWISALIALILGIFPLLIFLYLKNYDEKLNILNLNNKVFGNKGTILNMILAVGTFLLVLIAFLNLTYFVNSQFLFKTKYIYISICFIIPIIYALIKGINAITKTSLILLYFVIIIIIIIIFSLYPNINIDNIKPILETSKQNIFSSALLLIAYNVLPLVLLLIIPKEKIKNYNIKTSLISYLLAMGSIANAAFFTISIFGKNLALIYDYPEFHILKKVKVGDFADRLENVLVLEWIIALFILIVIGLYFITETLKKEFKLKEKTSKFVSTIACLLILLISQFSLTLNESIPTLLENALVPILYICFLIIPLITMIAIKLKKLKC